MVKPLSAKEFESLIVIGKPMTAIRVPPEHIAALLRLKLIELVGGIKLTSLGRERVKLGFP
jgi:hypothetical protein